MLATFGDLRFSGYKHDVIGLSSETVLHFWHTGRQRAEAVKTTGSNSNDDDNNNNRGEREKKNFYPMNKTDKTKCKIKHSKYSRIRMNIYNIKEIATYTCTIAANQPASQPSHQCAEQRMRIFIASKCVNEHESNRRTHSTVEDAPNWKIGKHMCPECTLSLSLSTNLAFSGSLFWIAQSIFFCFVFKQCNHFFIRSAVVVAITSAPFNVSEWTDDRARQPGAKEM